MEYGWLSLLTFGVSILVFVYAKRSTRDPKIGAERFITRFGSPQSIFAIKYFGEPERAREEFLSNSSLRRRYVIEQYVNAALLAFAGILLLVLEVIN